MLTSQITPSCKNTNLFLLYHNVIITNFRIRFQLKSPWSRWYFFMIVLNPTHLLSWRKWFHNSHVSNVISHMSMLSHISISDLISFLSNFTCIWSTDSGFLLSADTLRKVRQLEKWNIKKLLRLPYQSFRILSHNSYQSACNYLGNFPSRWSFYLSSSFQQGDGYSNVLASHTSYTIASINLLQASGSFFFRSKAMREHKCNQGGRKPVDLFSFLKYFQVFSGILKYSQDRSCQHKVVNVHNGDNRYNTYRQSAPKKANCWKVNLGQS